MVSIHKRDSSTGWRRSDGVFVRGEGWLVLNEIRRAHRTRCPAWRRGNGACDCGKIRRVGGTNIVTDAGQQDIAENYVVGNIGAGSSTLTFDDISVYTAISPSASVSSDFNDLTIPTGGTKDVASGWPQTSGSDGGDNPGTTGVDVISWKSNQYGTADANGTLIGAAIHESGASGTDALFNATAFSGSETKTSSQTAVVYLNQEINEA